MPIFYDPHPLEHCIWLVSMAGFHTHITFSSVFGVGYAGAGYLSGIPLDTALVGGGLCGLSGMLPDLDSDSGIPLRESMAFAAATVPMLLLDRLQLLGLRHDTIVFSAAALYFFVRFGATKLIAGRTVHRGMFHSIPAALIFAGVAFLLCGPCSDVTMRYYKAGGVLLGVMSHLLLDEIYSVEWKGGRWRLKRSAGTAIKLWGTNSWANFSTYSKLAIVTMLILSEPAVMQRLETRSPRMASTIKEFQGRWDRATPGSLGSLPPHQGAAAPHPFGSYDGQLPDDPGGPYPGVNESLPTGSEYFNPDLAPTGPQPSVTPEDAPRYESIYDTARNLYRRLNNSGPSPTE